MLGQISLDHVLTVLGLIAALGLVTLGIWTLTTRRIPKALLRLRGKAGAGHPVRFGGFWLLFGAASVLLTTADIVDPPNGLDTVMFALAGVAGLSSLVWYAVRQD
ncbi:hypothetical protein [Actinoplanes sp. M2I2]|uniref:hypothetical protein n=1 Tax=Actinoplanes sp. M2I2 TaxID=1734444 RepID=UPI00202225A3|nr:hypothetical protein [Actinoplanes sp. M2I2]